HSFGNAGGPLRPSAMAVLLAGGVIPRRPRETATRPDGGTGSRTADGVAVRAKERVTAVEFEPDPDAPTVAEAGAPPGPGETAAPPDGPAASPTGRPAAPALASAVIMHVAPAVPRRSGERRSIRIEWAGPATVRPSGVKVSAGSASTRPDGRRTRRESSAILRRPPPGSRTR